MNNLREKGNLRSFIRWLLYRLKFKWYGAGAEQLIKQMDSFLWVRIVMIFEPLKALFLSKLASDVHTKNELLPVANELVTSFRIISKEIKN